MGLPRSIFIAAHVSPIYGPVQALAGYLKRKKAAFRLAGLPFSYSGMRGAFCERWEGGRLRGTARGHAPKGFEPWLWVKDFFFVLRQGFSAGRAAPVELFIGIDCLNAAAGIILRRLGRVEKVVYYVIDYTTRRFGNPVLNAVYHFIDRFAVRGADVIWNLSSRMQEVRRAQGAPDGKNRHVPVGVELKAVRHPPRSGIKRKRLLYMGALQESKGIQLLIEAMPEITKKVRGAQLHIIGYGPYAEELKRLAAGSPARKAIFMPGGMEHGELFRRVPEFGVAFATYLEEKESYTYWCDPTKPKEYLACGLPLIITKVPWIWERVADRKKPMGLAISYNRRELVRACVKLLKDEAFYWRCRRNALDFAGGLEWSGIFDRAFRDLEAGVERQVKA